MPTNLMQLISMIRSCGNPQQMVIQMLEQQASSNPFMSNLLSLAKQGDGKSIENIAKNMMKEKGLDFDKEFNSFKNTLGL